ncbi:MAG: helix-turn-helix transcriptional regulator [Myxococcales bacterium]|nr:helix-turn-helix transcriptional regulator [Myxococcales bacterium]
MEPISSALIDFAEAAYSLECNDDDWLPALLAAGTPVLDYGLGVFALTCTRPPQSGPLVVDRVHAISGLEDLAERVRRAERETPPDVLWALSRPTIPKTLSEAAGDQLEAFRFVMRQFDFARDGLGMSSFDPNGHGVYLIAPLPKVTTLSEKVRDQFQMLAAHLGAGYRLRRALTDSGLKPETDLPRGAEALIDPNGFRIVGAEGPAKSKDARAALRDAALRVDQARGRMREKDPGKALELWTALVRGRWSTVDWFDSDGRRFVLGLPNAPTVIDPRGLTDREHQVVAYAITGQTNKLIAYQLGLSKGRVSTLMRSAMRKLGVQTRAQLIKKLRDFKIFTDA